MKAILHIKEKGPGRGWWGPPKGTHTTTLKKVPRHVWERAGQRTGFSLLRKRVKQLRASPVFPESKKDKWYIRIHDGPRLVGTLVGNDAVAQTMLGPRMKPKPGSVEIAV